MPHLSIRLLGPFEANLDGIPLARFHSDKVRALLAYLCVECQGDHRREKLAGLLWPDSPERTARSNLRNALANLRQVLGDRQQPGQCQTPQQFLKVTRQTIQFNRDSDNQVDIWDLLAVLEVPYPPLAELARAVELYQAEFMEGFSLPDSGLFEEWLLLQRERFNRLVLNALYQLALGYLRLGEFERALVYAWRQVEMDPFQENAQRQLISLLAYNGQDSQALAQYEIYQSLLASEFNADPSDETTEVYQQIRDGTLDIPHPPSVPPPPFLLEDEDDKAEKTVFVAREDELDRLDQVLTQSVAGQGRIVFVIGEPGSGKTALTQEFIRRAMNSNPELISVRGRCNAFTGIGDPYLPFLEIMQALTGDIETRWTGGEISGRQACRLWAKVPEVVQVLLDDGPDLIDRFVPGGGLLARARTGAPSEASRLADFLDRRASSSSVPPNLQQVDLFEQYTKVLKRLSRKTPLILVLDDLQWADPGSIGLLFHLGRRLAGSQLLLLGAYRPAELVERRKDGEQHPLENIISEFQRDLGEIHIDLDESEGWSFVEAFLATEPNRLETRFVEDLFNHTRGHPLFTIELVRSLQERGGLVRDDAGFWITGPSLNWDTLPPRVEAVIGERLGRLPEEWQSLLAAASVEGEEFTAEAVALVRKTDEDQILQLLSGPLSQKHKLIQAQEFLWQSGQRLSHYRFRHILFQIFLYNKLDPVQRAHTHQAVGMALEKLHGEEAGKLSVPLARHFEGAGMTIKAVEYLLQAGDRAARLFANDEAISHFKHGLELIKTLDAPPQRDQLELTLLLALGVPLMATHGFSGTELAETYGRARELTRGSRPSPELYQTLAGLKAYYDVHGDFQEAREIGEDLLRVAGKLNAPGLAALAHQHMSATLLYLGHPSSFLEHRERMGALYDPERDRSLVYQMGLDAQLASLYHAGWAYWFLGHPDQARLRSEEAVALARDWGHPFFLSFALMFAAFSSVYRRDVKAARELAEETIAVASEHGHPLWLGGGLATMGWVLGEEGKLEEGITSINDGQNMLHAIGARLGYLQVLCLLAETFKKAGRVSEGLAVTEEALAIIQEMGAWMEEPEVHRLQGELLLMQGKADTKAETCFQRAVEEARRQGAKSWELRATMSLCRLWQKQGRVEDAKQALHDIYSWFTEGFDTPDLMEAKTLLTELL